MADWQSRVLRIDDPADPRLAAYRDIRERDLVGREGLFIAEGKVVVDVLVASARHQALSFLILENRLAGMSPVLARSPAAAPVFVASAAVINAVAGFDIHRGVLAVGRRLEEPDAAGLLGSLPAPATVVALSGIANHDNVGAIFRNAAAFGATAVLLDDGCCDPLYRKAIRVSAGHALRLPFARAGSPENMLRVIQAAGFSPLALSPRGARDIRSLDPTERVALLLGAEGEGLPQSVLDRVETVHIAMARGIDSLNVATAAAIALYELSAKRLPARR